MVRISKDNFSLVGWMVLFFFFLLVFLWFGFFSSGGRVLADWSQYDLFPDHYINGVDIVEGIRSLLQPWQLVEIFRAYLSSL